MKKIEATAAAERPRIQYPWRAWLPVDAAAVASSSFPARAPTSTRQGQDVVSIARGLVTAGLSA
ncbi:hypothetical protein [Labrys miyagiensis]|uniref:hypothetical protein n=1 Tax=Labrys miyagiensis TaxID=346912 RepID=UPI0024E166D7|nr:hypothetical protein [Labrys miyagiensis]